MLERMRILLVEDDLADIRLLREALKDAGDWCDLEVARTGAQALDMLLQRGSYSTYKLPHLVLLDIRLPILSGHEVLNAIKAYAPLNVLPIIILSTSESPEDIRRAYALGASCYIVKPHDLQQFIEICKSIYGFWCEGATLPLRSEQASN
jgi:chemotaxis family two-component system response regulator Rcp1